MSRYIDAEKFIDHLGLEDAEEVGEENYGEILTLSGFDNQPTTLVINGLTVEECIEKQIPKKPMDVCDVPFDVPYGVCSVCGDGVTGDMHFCSTCGNALDWSGKDEK